MTDAFFNYFRGGEPFLFSHFLAKFFGLYLIIFGLFMLIRHDFFKKVASDVRLSSSLEATWSLLPIIAGLLLVLLHNIWVPEWPVLITLLGWFFLLLGIARLFFPEAAYETSSKLVTGPLGYIWGALWLALGLILTWFGFFN